METFVGFITIKVVFSRTLAFNDSISCLSSESFDCCCSEEVADDARRDDAVDALRVVGVPVVAADKRRDDVAEGGDALLVAGFLIVDDVLAVDVGILDDEAVVVVVVMRDVARVALAVDGFLDVMDPCVLPAVVVLGGEREMELLLPEVAFDDVKAEVLLVFVASVMLVY